MCLPAFGALSCEWEEKRQIWICPVFPLVRLLCEVSLMRRKHKLQVVICHGDTTGFREWLKLPVGVTSVCAFPVCFILPHVKAHVLVAVLLLCRNTMTMETYKRKRRWGLLSSESESVINTAEHGSQQAGRHCCRSREFTPWSAETGPVGRLPHSNHHSVLLSMDGVRTNSWEQ